MACNLSRSTDPLADYMGKVNDQVRLAVTASAGQAIVSNGRYAGQPLAAPWSFTIKSGINSLSLLINNPIVNDPMQIVEACAGGTTNVLREFNSDPIGVNQAFMIKGVE